MSVFANVWPRDARLPPLVLESVRVVLRPPGMEDWADWAEVRGRNRAYLKPFEPRWPDQCLTKKFFKARLRRQHSDWTNNASRYFLIRRKDDGTLIGGVNINNLALGAARHGSLGYWLDEAHQGQGYMQESLSCVLYYGFTALALQRMNAACIPVNHKSMRLLRRLGFSEEGYARHYIQIDGVWHDHHLFGLTRPDYLSMAGIGGERARIDP